MTEKSEQISGPKKVRSAEDLREVIRRLNLKIEAQPDGTMEVEEAIRYALGELKAIDRERAAAEKANG